MARRDYDVVVVGGGPAGCTVSCMLAKKGVSVLCVEDSGHLKTFKIGESLHQHSKPLLAKLGILDELTSSTVTKTHIASKGTHSLWGEKEAELSPSNVWSRYGDGWHVDRVTLDDKIMELR